MSRVFVDASVLFPAAYSETSSARDLIRLSLRGQVTLLVSRLVLEETERNIRKKAPTKLVSFRAIVEAEVFTLVPDPTKEEVLAALEYTVLKDAPIVAAAKAAQVDYLVTYDHKDLLDKPEVAAKSGLRIVTPDIVVAAIKEEADKN